MRPCDQCRWPWRRAALIALLVAHATWSQSPAQEPAAAPARRPKLIVQVGHRTEVTAIAVSPDGKFVATGDADGRLFVWDATSGKILRELKFPMPESAVDPSGQTWIHIEAVSVGGVGFSPDGTYVAASAKGLHLWETNTGKLVSRVDDELSAPWGFSADGQQLIAENLRLTRNAEGTLLVEPQPLVERQFAVDSDVLAITVGKKWSAQGDVSGKVAIYDSQTFELSQRLRILVAGTLVEVVDDADSDRGEHGEAITALAIGKNDDSLLIGSRCGSVVLFDVPSRKALWTVALRDPVERLVTAADGKTIVATTAHGFQVLASDTGREIQRFDVNRAVLCGVFSADGTSALTGHGDRLVRLWDTRTGKPLRRFEGSFGAITAVAYVDKGQTVAAFDTYGILSLWNTANGVLLRQLDVPRLIESREESPANEVARPALAPSDVLQDSRGDEPYGLGFEPYRRSRAVSWRYADMPRAIFCNQGKTLLFCGRSGSGTKGSIDVPTGRKLAAPPADFDPPNVLAVSADGRFVVADKMAAPTPDSAEYNSEVWLASQATGKYISKVADNGPVGGPTIAAISSDNVWVAIDDGGSHIRVVGASNGRTYATLDASQVLSLAFSPRATQLALGGRDGSAQLWDRATGKLIQSFVGHDQDVTSVAFSPNGRLVLTTSADETARLWNGTTGQQLLALQEDEPTVASVELTARGGLVVARRSGDVNLHDTPSGPVTRQWKLGRPGEQLNSVCLNGVTEQLIVNIRSHQQRQQLGPRLSIQPLAEGARPILMQDSSKSTTTYGQIATFAPEKTQIVSVSASGDVRTWNEQGLASRHKLAGGSNFHRGTMLDFSRGRQYLAAMDDLAIEAGVRIWELSTGKLVEADERTDDLLSFPSDLNISLRLDQAGQGSELIEWKTERVLKSFPDAKTGDLSLDGSRLVTAHDDGMVRIWDVPTLNELASFRMSKGRQATEQVQNWKDGGSFLGLLGELAALVSALDGKDPPPAKPEDMPDVSVPEEPEQPHRAHTVFFSPTARSVITNDGPTLKVWDAATGMEQCELDWPAIPLLSGEEEAEQQPKVIISNVEFSPDEQWLVGSTGPYVWDVPQQGFIVVWEAETGKVVRVIRTPAAPSSPSMFSPDGRLILQSGADDAIYLWHRETGTLACQLVMIDDENWAVVDEEGRYDASRGGDVEAMHWVIGNEPIALSQLKERYYEPGLLSKVLGLNPEPLRDVKAFRDVKLFPDVHLSGLTPDDPNLTIRLTNRGGGLGRVVVKVNGKELMGDARGEAFLPNAPEATLPPIDLARDPRILRGRPNVIEVQAFNAEGYLSSRGLELEFTSEQDDEDVTMRVWGIVAGVSDYRGDAIDLTYAAKDASDFASALKIAATRLYQAENVHLMALTGSQAESESRATRQNLIDALTAAKAATADDILVIYLAGHGVNYGGQDGDFYYLTSDAQSADLADEEVRRQSAISSAELTELINQIPALKQVFVLDTCASGKLVEKLTQRREVPSSQTRALRRVKDRTGTYLLAGCAADRVSYETSRYAQGLLTYSLLFGMRGPALRDGKFVDVSKLFDYATDRVPELAADIGGVQRPILASPKAGGSFDIGELSVEDKQQIPLQTTRPLVLRANFQDEEKFRDHLNLSKQVNDLLRDVSARGRNAEVVFVDADEFPGAYDVVGRYRLRAGKVSVTVLVSQGEEEQTRFDVVGNASNLRELAVEIIDKTKTQLSKIPASQAPSSPTGPTAPK